MSDYDKYKPWNTENFSGKVKYILDNNEEYEVFREFNKKNPKIYNENLEDISSNFSIDKTKGNQFFIEQTGIDENLFFNTMTICQDEVVLDNAKQNVLVQKITNVVSSGDDNVSYKKTIDKLNKKMLEEVGTARTVGRPINIIEDEIKGLEENINELELYKVKVQNSEIEKEEINTKLKRVQEELNILKNIQEYKRSEQLEEQKIDITVTKLKEYKDKLKLIKDEKEKSSATNTNKNYINPIILLTILILIIGLSVLLKNALISTFMGIISAIIFFVNFNKYSKFKDKKIKQDEETIRYNKEIEIIQESVKQYNDEIEKGRKEIEQNQIEVKNELANKFGNSQLIENYIYEDIQKIDIEIDNKQNQCNEIMLRENTFDIEKNNIYLQLENLVKQEERLQYLYEQKAELNKLSNSIKYAQEGLEEAYTIMKNTVTPRFTEELTDIIKQITNEKYKKVKFNDTDGLTVELENGEYINCNKLSIGTIDQMYLALRLSVLNQISKETMPLILDEPFVYYDKERLENILKYLSQECNNRQIIILTCTNREIEVLDSIGIGYNLIEL